MQKNDKKLLAVCYAVFFAASVLICVFRFGFDSLLRAQDKLVSETLCAEDFDLTSLVQQDDLLISENDDPRMVLKNCPERVCRVEIAVTFENMDPGEFTLFYKPRANMEDFDANYRLWAEIGEDGTYSFTLPQGKIYGLRIDPGIYGGIRMKMTDIRLNPAQSVFAYFAPSTTWLLLAAIVPALAAGALRYGGEVRKTLRARRTAGGENRRA